MKIKPLMADPVLGQGERVNLEREGPDLTLGF